MTTCAHCGHTVQPLDSEPYYTLEELAAELHCSRDTVKKAIDAGDIPGVRIGNRYRMYRRAFENMVNYGWKPAAEPTVIRIYPAGETTWNG